MSIFFLTCIIPHQLLLIRHSMLSLFLHHLHIIFCLICLISHTLPHLRYQALPLIHTINQPYLNPFPVDHKDRKTLILTFKITTALYFLRQLTIQLLQSPPTSGIIFPTTFLTIDFHTITNISHLVYPHNLNLLVLRKLYVMKVGNRLSNLNYHLLLRLTPGSLLLYLVIKSQLAASGFSKSSSKPMDPLIGTRLD